MDSRPAPRAEGAGTRTAPGPNRRRTTPSPATRSGAGRSPAPRRAASDRRPSWLRTFGRNLARLAVNPTTRAGLVGLALVFVGLSSNLGARTPAYYNIDETAHVGYVSSLAEGRLPEIENPIEVEVADPALASRLKNAADDQRTVWVSNHPPGAYLPAVPIAWVTNALGIESALPISLRIAGILGGVFAVGFAYLLGREVGDGDERAGLVAAAITVCVPTFTFVSGTGLTDSASMAAGLAVTWMAVRMVRLGYTQHRTYWLAAFVAMAGFTRLTSAVIAVATVLLLAVLAKRDRLRFLATALLPVVAVAGWYYLRVQRLYGDVAASEYLLERMGPNRGVVSSKADTLTSGWLWDDITRGLVMSAPPYRFMFGYVWFRLLKVAVVASVVAVAVTPVIRYLGRSPRPPFDLRRLDDRGTGKAGVCTAAVLAVSVVLPFAFMVQHLAGGGGRHSRYLLPMVPVVAAIIARGIGMLPAVAARWTRIGVVAIGAFVSYQLIHGFELPQFYPVVNRLWIETLLPQAVATVAATIAVLGFALVFWSLSVPPDRVLFPAPEPTPRRTGPTRPRAAAPAPRPSAARRSVSPPPRQPAPARRPTR